VTRVLHKEISIRAPLSTLWDMWTTADGLRFVSESSRVTLEPGGDYAWFLDLEPDDRGNREARGAPSSPCRPCASWCSTGHFL
jgi:hypothetical protein